MARPYPITVICASNCVSLSVNAGNTTPIDMQVTGTLAYVASGNYGLFGQFSGKVPVGNLIASMMTRSSWPTPV